MTLVYRSVWDDDWCEPLRVLDDEFASWCKSKGIDLDEIPRRGRLHVSDTLSIEIRRADAEMGRALRCSMTETDQRGRTWVTTATALADSETRTFWVDVECNDPFGGQPEMAAPRLVRSLIDAGGRPTSYGASLRADAIQVNRTDAEDLAAAVSDENRQVPIVVFSPDPTAPPAVTNDRADAAARTLAGLAGVYSVQGAAIAAFNTDLPEGFGVYGGAVRLYLPRPRIDDPDDVHRHRWIPLRLISAHQRRAASMLAARLARLQLHPPIPPAWGKLEALLRRPSDADVEARAAQILTADTSEAGIAATAPDADELARRLAFEQLQHANDIGALLGQNEALLVQLNERSEAVRTTETELYDNAAELEGLRSELDELRRSTRRQIRALLGNAHEPAAQADTDPHELAVPTSIGEAIDLARQHLRFVEIPDAALHDIDELEATPNYASWASSMWQGLLALDGYSRAKSNGEHAPGFKIWCENTGAWPTRTKLAMKESRTVTTNDELRGQRRFPVSRDVDPSGHAEMFSHLKIVQGGGSNIPRVYFFDDTDGATRRIHVGFIGPHRHVENTKT